MQVQGVRWESVLEFTQLFRSFRLAINPAKIIMALIAIMLIYTAGRFFDVVWGPQVFVGEIESFQNDKSDSYSEQRHQKLETRRFWLADRLRATSPGAALPDEIDRLAESPRSARRTIQSNLMAQYAKDLQEISKTRAEDETVRQGLPPIPGVRTPAEIENERRVRKAAKLLDDMSELKRVTGTGIFDAFLQYEVKQFDALVVNTLSLVRIAPVKPSSADIDLDTTVLSVGAFSSDSNHLWKSDTIAGCLANMSLTAPAWLFSGTGPMQWRPENAGTWSGWIRMMSFRGLYLASVSLLVLFSIFVMALAGGMICRLSALEIAGIERAPLKDVFLFTSRRLAVFVKTPLAPLAIILVLGLGLAVLGLIGAIPFVGEILVGILLVAFFAIAFVLMLLLLGILGGFNLLYPTLAVEGSDTFDAMSRAFAYAYARPWRLAFYTLVSLIYGVATFLFVSFAVYLILAVTHTCAGWGVNVFGYNHGWYSGIAKLDTLWPAPKFGHLINPVNWYAMSVTEFLGSLFLYFWVFLLISSIGAYVISYYFSSHTLLYMLIRRSVDGQSLSEVCVDEAPATKAAAVPSPTPSGPPTATEPSAPTSP